VTIFAKRPHWVLLIPAFIAAGYATYSRAGQCEVPIEFKIGRVDVRFGITQRGFQDAIIEAGNLWGRAIEKKLFEYNPSADLTINLVYDERQLKTQKEIALETGIAQSKETADTLRPQISTLQENYKALRQQYSDRLAHFTDAQEDYNRRVDNWNSAGGAPHDEYRKLTDEKETLLSEQRSLEQERRQVNELADQVNAYVNKYNSLVTHTNAVIHAIKHIGLAGTEFEEGQYVVNGGTKFIDIYQFRNRTHLILILAHELGHVLGLGHNTNPNSIMAPIIRTERPTLSADDLNGLRVKCGL
jgi:predicted Zn-dependent protease